MAAGCIERHSASTIAPAAAESRRPAASYRFRGDFRAGASAIKFPDGNVLVAR